MSKKPFAPPIPRANFPDQEVIEKMENMTPKERRQFKKSAAYKKHVRPAIKRHKSAKRKALAEWWWNKGIVILNTVLALIAAITGIIALLR